MSEGVRENLSPELLTQRDIQSILREHFSELSQRFHVKRVGIFGSYVRDEQSDESDVDLLVEFNNEHLTLLEFIELKIYLSDLLGVPVDLVEKDMLKPEIGKHVLQEVIPL